MVGSAGIALLIASALLIGAVPYAVSLLGVAQLPNPGGLLDLDALDLALRAGGAFLIYASRSCPPTWPARR